MATCKVDGCDREANVPGAARGMCKLHYQRWQRNGTTEARRADKPCNVEGCTRKHAGIGLCAMHLKRLRKTGSVSGGRVQEEPMIRFWKKVNVQRGGCWLWTAGTDDSGYGRFNADTNRRNLGAHRWSYETFTGDIPDGLELDHLCRVRHCVNPTHLEPVTSRENSLRGETLPAANAAKTHCPQGHPYNDENTFVNSRGSRECRTCKRKRERERARSNRTKQ